jgi:mRNA-degrading endonuclease RelE of RelBE toxin-antitoxin system
MRWRAGGRGKRGGIRVIYYWHVPSDRLVMLLAYPKSEQDDLTPAQRAVLRKVVESEYP